MIFVEGFDLIIAVAQHSIPEQLANRTTIEVGVGALQLLGSEKGFEFRHIEPLESAVRKRAFTSIQPTSDANSSHPATQDVKNS
jgi:hypothetical protein